MLIILAKLRDLPSLQLRGALMFLSFFAPMLVIASYARANENELLYVIAGIYGVLYILITILVIRRLLKFSQNLRKKDYDYISMDQAAFRFIFSLLINVALNFTLFYCLSRMIIQR